MKGIWPSPEYLAHRRRVAAAEAKARLPYAPASKPPMASLPPAAQDPPPEAKWWHCDTDEVDWIDVAGECWCCGGAGTAGALVFRNFGSK